MQQVPPEGIPNTSASILRELYEGSADQLISVQGEWGAGKTAVLRSLAEQLRSDSKLLPIVISPPSSQIDTGAIGVVQLSIGIGYDQERITDVSKTWSSKLDAMRSRLTQHKGSVVLLCDEPQKWHALAVENRRFAGHATDLANLLLNVQCRRVISGIQRGSVSVSSTHILRKGADLVQLHEPERWRSLASSAKSLLTAGGPRLGARSSLELGLLVALTEIAPEAARQQLLRHSTASQLAKVLASELVTHQGYRHLAELWRLLALLRRPFEGELLRVLSQNGFDDLNPKHNDILELCLLHKTPEGYDFHDSLRRSFHDEFYLPSTTIRAAHARIAAYYRNSFERTTDSPNALLAEMEAFHHASESGDQDLFNGLRPFFVDQLDARGRALSRQRRYPDAVMTFREALNWDAADDYAHHYYGFNLDIQGLEALTVEEHYRSAINLDPLNVWWWSRFISFLITRSRIAEARQALGEALETLNPFGSDPDQYIYQHMHKWIVRLLLHRGRLDFAREVLDDIPVEVKTGDASFRALQRYLDSLTMAQDAAALFPLYIMPEYWWLGPHLSPRNNSEGQELIRWMPGRVEGVLDGTIELTIGIKDTVSSSSTPGIGGLKIRHISLTFVQFEEASLVRRASDLKKGDFVELAFYAGGSREDLRISVHPQRGWTEEDLPPLRLDPDRYLKRASTVFPS